jgi:uncharacterized membrane protein YhdT
MTILIFIIGAIGGTLCFSGFTFGTLLNDGIKKDLSIQIMIGGAFVASPIVFYILYNIDWGDGGKAFPVWFDSLYYLIPPIMFLGGCWVLYKAINEYKLSND